MMTPDEVSLKLKALDEQMKAIDEERRHVINEQMKLWTYAMKQSILEDVEEKYLALFKVTTTRR